MNIMVRNLSGLVTEEKLIAQFRPYGTVSSASIVTDKTTGQSRGFGFVEMPLETEAHAAIKALHHSKFFKEKIRVKEANPKFGPRYFSEHEQLQTVTAQPVPLRLVSTSGEPVEKPFVEGAFGKSHISTAKKTYQSKLSRREAHGHSYPDRKPEYRPWNERPFARPFSSEGKSRSGKGGSNPVPAARLEYQPKGERHFNRSEYKPMGERKYDRNNKNGRKEYAYPTFPKRDYKKSSSAPRTESKYGYRSSGERYIKTQSGFRSDDSKKSSYPDRPEYKPQGKRTYVSAGGGQNSTVESNRRYSVNPRHDGSRHGFGHHNIERPYGYRGPKEAASGQQGYNFKAKSGRKAHSYGKQEFNPRSDQPFSRHSTPERRDRPYSRFTKQGGRKFSPSHDK